MEVVVWISVLQFRVEIGFVLSLLIGDLDARGVTRVAGDLHVIRVWSHFR